MRTPCWTFNDNRATAQFGALCASIDLTQASDGLTHIALRNDLLSALRILGISICQPNLTDRYCRGNDLVVTYGPSASWPVQVSAMWRVREAGADATVLAGVDLIVSVRTEILDSWPELSICSYLAAEQVLQPIDAAGPRCMLFRFGSQMPSYVEMVHPADAGQDEIRGPNPNSPGVRSDHHLFARALEKGVILRGRVRGIFVAREADVATATAEYRCFAADEPPLGT